MTGTMLRLPDRVILPCRPHMTPGAVCAALGISRQLLHLWRRRHGFPVTGPDGFVRTEAVAAWLVDRSAVIWL